MQGRFIIYFIWIGLTVYLGYVLYHLALFDSLSSIANDSINYLAMARYLSPWQTPSEAVQQIWSMQDFPPLFPLLLATTGAAHSLWYAHALVVLIGLMVLPVYYRVARKILAEKHLAVIAVVVFALSPGYLLGLQGILSEALYLLLSLLLLLLYPGTRRVNNRHYLVAALLLAAVLLTRTIGFALLLAVFAHAVADSVKRRTRPMEAIAVLAISILVYFAVMSFFGPDRESHYSTVIREVLEGADFGVLMGLWMHHINALLEAWHTHWLLYWVSELSVNYIVVLLMLLLAVAEWLIRLRRNELDAWYLLFYLGVLSIWPHPGQMLRLLLPVVPILVIYSVGSVYRLTSRLLETDLGKYASLVFLALLLVSVMPSHAFIHGRLELAASRGLIPVYEIFRKPDVGIAARDLLLHNQILADFTMLSSLLPPDARIMYFSPSYPAVIANLPSDKLYYPVSHERNRPLAEVSDNLYILLTALHPRMTREGYDGFRGEAVISGWSEKRWCSFTHSDSLRASCLYKVMR